MMIDKRLIGLVESTRRMVAVHVGALWCALVANICLMVCFSELLACLVSGKLDGKVLALALATACVALALRAVCTLVASRMSHLSSAAVKATLREAIFAKLFRLGASYREQVKTSEVVQVAVEGVDQLESYFGAYLPQFFYALLAPLTLFVVLCTVNVPAALVLLVCVPLIPIAIAAVQTWAKRLLGDYWTQYTGLGDTFLENLQGLTTLKIYQADAQKNLEMNAASESFRKITMKVLRMQLNSIAIMDIVAYLGAALGMIIAVREYARGTVDLAGCLLIVLLAADFFIPMRQLGSYFHIAMNGMAASDKIFRLLELPENPQGEARVNDSCAIHCDGLCFAYDDGREVLHDLSFDVPAGGFMAIVGASGCGKSTIAGILSGRNKGYHGAVTIGGIELHTCDEAKLLQNVTYVSHNSVLFKGSVRENLQLAAVNADDAQLWQVLYQVNLADYFAAVQGLDTQLSEGAANLSGGQRQRLALARAILHDSPVYIFDEATSNIDVESEEAILRVIHELAKTRTVILISHRLANVVAADWIIVMENGCIVAQGQHEALLAQPGVYATLWQAQQALEHIGKECELACHKETA